MKSKFLLVGFSLLLALIISILPGSQANKVSAEPAGCVPGPHHGTIATSETWCKADNPHFVDYPVIVPAGVALTIEPGAVVKFYSNASLSVAGSLIANGTSTPGEQILFTSDLPSPGQGSWPGISAGSGSTLQISYFEMAYAGQAGFDYGSLTIRTPNASLSHCRIHDGLGTALFLDNPGITPQLDDVEIDHYTGAGLYQNNISMNPIYQNIRLHDTATNGLLLSGGLTDRDITLDGSPAAFNGAPIFMGYGLKVGSGTTMRITPGTTLKNNEGISVAESATLVAEGMPAAPIIFTAIAEPPLAGSWGGINAAPGSALTLSYCEVAYAGKAGGAFGAVQIETSKAVVNQCRIHDSSTQGIYIKAATPFPIWNNVLTDNDGAALDVESGGRLQALQTTLARNQVGLYVPSGSAALTNSIVANNPIGVQQAYAGSITLNYTLFQGNANAIVGTVTDTNHIEGVVAFEADGYHLSKTSDAIDAAADAGVNMDIDGDPRPIGSDPDLGADEYRDAISPVFAKDGGRLTYTDQQGDSTEVIVPPGAVNQDTVLTFKVIDSVTPPSTYRQTGHAFHLDGYQGGFLMPGLAFDTPVRITLHYSDADVIGLDRKTLTLWYWNGSMWSDAACGVYERHPTQNWLAVPVCHLSIFSFFGQPQSSAFIPMIRR